MARKKLLSSLLIAASLMPALAAARDCIVEVKGAYFRPTNHLFRKIYHNAGIVGAEGTFNLCNQIYGFAAIDYLRKKGYSIGLSNPTKVSILDFEVGLKYFVPIDCSCWDVDFYVGLGALPVRLHTHDISPYVIPYRTKWSCGGIAKVGAYFNLCQCFVLDIFFNYSFAKVGFHGETSAPTVSHSARLSGCWFGAGLGYRFDL